MFRFPERFLFNPTQNLDGLAPILLVIAGLVVLATLIWLLWHVRLIVEQKHQAWNSFLATAGRYGLTRREVFYLKQLLRKETVSDPARWIVEEDRFERLVTPLESKGRSSDIRYIQSIRRKLFGRSPEIGDSIQSTREIPAGCQFHVENMKFHGKIFKGNLIDVDSSGLVVVFPEEKNQVVPVHTNAQLNITAYVPNRPPVRFSSWVESVIPGPKKMVVIGHSDFVVSGDRPNRPDRIVSPQVWEQERKPTYPSKLVPA